MSFGEAFLFWAARTTVEVLMWLLAALIVIGGVIAVDVIKGRKK